MLAQLVNLCLLIVAKIANAECRMTNCEIKSKQLAERWGRNRRCDNKVMIIVVTSENLVITLSVIGRECQSEKRYLHFISQLERKISKTETVGSDSIRSDIHLSVSLCRIVRITTSRYDASCRHTNLRCTCEYES